MTDPRSTLRRAQSDARTALQEVEDGADDERARRRRAGVVERYLDMEERVLFDVVERHDPDAEPVITRARRRHRQMLEDLRTLEDLAPTSEHGGDNLRRLRRELGEHIGAIDQWLLPRLTHLDEQEFDDLGDALEEARQTWGGDSTASSGADAGPPGATEPQGPRTDEARPPHEAPSSHEARPPHEAQSGTRAPGAWLAAADRPLPSTPEPNEPA